MASQNGASLFDADLFKSFDFGAFGPAAFAKFSEPFKMPAFNGQDLIEAQRKNFEAINAANRIALEGVQALARRQAEILQETVEETNKAMRKASGVSKPEEALVRQTELLKDAFAHGVANARELAEMGSKSQGEAFETLNKRFAEGLDEIASALKASTKA